MDHQRQEHAANGFHARPAEDSQRSELMRMIDEVRSLQENLRQHQSPDVQQMLDENDRLAKENRVLTQEFDQLRAQCEEHLHQQEEGAATLAKALEELREENQQLQQLLQEKEELLHKHQAGREELGDDLDLDGYESELNRFHQQLKADREKLNIEIEQVRVRQEEMDDETRELEMAMSRERAELARERVRMEKLREEVKADLERMQRDAAMLQSLAPVSRLREEITKKNQPGEQPKESGSRIGDRLSAFRSRLSSG